MKVKTSELQGAALDWAVAKAEGVDGYIVNESFMTRLLTTNATYYHYQPTGRKVGRLLSGKGLVLHYGHACEGDWCGILKTMRSIQWI
jgi:hypothetical protein